MNEGGVGKGECEGECEWVRKEWVRVSVSG